MSNYQRRKWLEELDALYNPPKKCFQAGIVRLGGFVKDQFYYDYRYPTVELPQLLAEHFRDKVDLFAWYSWADGLRYEFDRVTSPTAPRPIVATPPAPISPRDPGTAFNQVQEMRREETGRQGGSRFVDNVRDAIRELDELLKSRTDKHIVVLFHDVEWEFPTDNSQGLNLVPLVRGWPNHCLGHHLVIFTSNPMAEWIPRLITGQGVTDLDIAGPTVDEIKQRLIYEYLITNEPFFDWQTLDEVAAYFAEEYAQPNRSYRSFVVDVTKNRGDAVYNTDFVKLNRTSEAAVDYHAIDVAAFESYLNTHLIGQVDVKRWAITEVSRLQKRGVPPHQPKPIPVIRKLFTGPSGVGKTEIAKVICRFVFQRDPLMIPCSEYQEQDVARLLGAPPGYVGYGQPGELTRYFQEKPYGLILLDEFEKGPEKLRLFFMTALDQGHSKTPDGIRLEFGNTIVIATSNTGAREIDEQPDSEMRSPEQRQALYEQMIGQTYNQALLGRFSGFKIFDRLTDQNRLDIARLYVDLFVRGAKRDHGINDFAVTATDTFYAQLLARCPKTMGARKIEGAVRPVLESVLDIYFDSPPTDRNTIVLDWMGPYPVANGHTIETHL
jgi:hypothetical protein